MKINLPKRGQKVRFIAVGSINTLIDFTLLFLLTHFGVAVLIANFISTSVAFIFSFIANRSFTFKASRGNVRKQLTLFLIITLVGLWILQPITISFIQLVLRHYQQPADIVLLIAKMTATIITLVWNYFFYSRIIFYTQERE